MLMLFQPGPTFLGKACSQTKRGAPYIKVLHSIWVSTLLSWKGFPGTQKRTSLPGRFFKAKYARLFVPGKPFPACGQCYETFYGRKLRLFIISQSVCPWQAYQVYQVLLLGRFRPYPQTLDQVERLARDKRSSLLVKL